MSTTKTIQKYPNSDHYFIQIKNIIVNEDILEEIAKKIIVRYSLYLCYKNLMLSSLYKINEFMCLFCSYPCLKLSFSFEGRLMNSRRNLFESFDGLYVCWILIKWEDKLYIHDSYRIVKENRIKYQTLRLIRETSQQALI